MGLAAECLNLLEGDLLTPSRRARPGPAPPKLVHLKWESLGRVYQGGTHEEATDRRGSVRLLRDFDRDLAKGLTIPDVCRKINIAETTYYRWRQRHDPAQVDADRRCRRNSKVERLKRLVAELMLDKQMLQDIAKKKW